MTFYDPYSSSYDQSYELYDVSNGLWDASIGLTDVSHSFWLMDETYTALEFQQLADTAEYLSNEAYQASWDAWYGPVNSEGYTALDASHGYTTQDTSLIEPASSAGSMSMISDNTASWL